MDTPRRDMLLASLLTAAVPALATGTAGASPLNPAQTIIQPPDEHHWIPNQGYPQHSVDMCPLTGSTTEPGLYYTLVRWWPGYMSAPHTYTTDRLCVIVSGTWWCNSGPDFDPAACVPVRDRQRARPRRDRDLRHWPDQLQAGRPEPARMAQGVAHRLGLLSTTLSFRSDC
jgi:hypothetical protein